MDTVDTTWMSIIEFSLFKYYYSLIGGVLFGVVVSIETGEKNEPGTTPRSDSNQCMHYVNAVQGIAPSPVNSVFSLNICFHLTIPQSKQENNRDSMPCSVCGTGGAGGKPAALARVRRPVLP
jgi:hypothetical protein